MRLKGKFPHARYESLHSYAVGGSTPLDHLADIDTAPDKGSTNPFLPGADRTAKKRRYTVAISPTTPPAAGEPRAANTVYAESSDQQLIYRVYVPDKGSDFAGDTGLPKPVLTLADGTVVTGQALCDAVGSEGHALSSSSLPLSVYLTLRDQPDKPSTFPAVNPTRFRAYYSTAFTVKCVYQGVCEPPPTRVGGQYSNLDVNYVGGFVNREFGPVLVLRGKMPTTPATLKGNDKMKRAQLRYWSMCQNESLTTTRGAGCLFDEQVPLTKKRRFTIVTSLPADRPDNARRKCGVGFIPWPADGDGAGHPNDGLLLVRNMLPSKSFHQAVQDTRSRDEAEVAGPYPRGATRAWSSSRPVGAEGEPWATSLGRRSIRPGRASGPTDRLIGTFACVTTCRAGGRRRGSGSTDPGAIAGRTVISRGALVYTDYLYDAWGPDLDGNGNLPAFPSAPASQTSGDYRYPDGERYAGDAADLRELRLELTGKGLEGRVSLETMADPSVAIATVAIDSDGTASTGAGAWPDGANLTTPGADLFVTAWAGGARLTTTAGAVSSIPGGADVKKRRFDFRIPAKKLGKLAAKPSAWAGVGLASADGSGRYADPQTPGATAVWDTSPSRATRPMWCPHPGEISASRPRSPPATWRPSRGS